MIAATALAPSLFDTRLMIVWLAVGAVLVCLSLTLLRRANRRFADPSPMHPLAPETAVESVDDSVKAA